jgi:hypothetical protein
MNATPLADPVPAPLSPEATAATATTAAAVAAATAATAASTLEHRLTRLEVLVAILVAVNVPQFISAAGSLGDATAATFNWPF